MEVVELRLLVGTWLHNCDLVSCVRVSRTWYETYTPLLYSLAQDPTYQLHWSSFERHIHHVRDLRVPFNANPVHLEKMLANCRYLQQLTATLTWGGREVPFLLGLLKENPQLLQLGLIRNNRQRTTPKSLLRVAIEHCPRLSSLCLVSQELEGELLSQFLVISARLTKLELLYCRIQTKESCWKDWPGFPELRELTVTNSPTNLLPGEQLKLFQNCPKLETISWDVTNAMGNVESASEFVVLFNALLLKGHDREKQDNASGCWPRLHSISLTEKHHKSCLTDSEVAILLMSCPNLLRRLDFSLVTCGKFATKALLRHRETLQVLHLTTNGATIQEILSSCPHLMEFRGSTLLASDLAKQPGTHSEWLSSPSSPVTARPWVCLKLEVLKITVRREYNYPEEHALFEQLCRLKKLKDLHLCKDRANAGFGLDLRIHLGLDSRSTGRFKGEYHDPKIIKGEPVGRRLLEIWPELTSCCFCLV